MNKESIKEYCRNNIFVLITGIFYIISAIFVFPVCYILGFMATGANGNLLIAFWLLSCPVILILIPLLTIFFKKKILLLIPVITHLLPAIIFCYIVAGD